MNIYIKNSFIKFGYISIFLFFVFFANFTIGANPDSFIVSVDPATFDINQAVDLTVKAVTKNGDIVKDYEWMVMIEIEELFDDDDSYVLPWNNGVYTFVTEDQWAKTWFAGLKIAEEWKFTLKVWDISDDSIIWTQILIVWDWWELTGQSRWIADIITPISGETVNTQVINIMWKSDIVNSIVQVYINWEQIEEEAETDINGNYNLFIKDLQKWKNKMFVRLVDVNSKILAESDEIEFLYEPMEFDDFFKSIEITPSKDVAKNTKVKYKVEVWSSIKDVQMKIWTMFLPMDKSSDWFFEKETTMGNEWVQPISLTLIWPAGEKKTYNNVDYIKVWWEDQKVEENESSGESENTVDISNIKIIRDNLTNTQATISRESNIKPYSYIILYGTQSDNLDKSYNTAETTATIAWLDPNSEYYFQLMSMGENWEQLGDSSQIVTVKVHWSAGNPTDTANWNCVVAGISISNSKIWNQYFITRWAVPSATNYTIYRSDSTTANINTMQQVGTTTDTKFQYPFDPNIDKDARYAVQANCSDGTSAQIDSVKKVKVWPAENVILIVLVSIGFYYLNRMFKFIGG